MNRPLRIAASSLFLLPALIAIAAPALAQSLSAVPRLDPNQLQGSYYVIARYPIKREKLCLGKELVLFALGDKKRSIQMVTSCQVKSDNTNAWNASGKLSKAGDGKIKLGWIWPFTTRYWILDLAPDASWALAANPNRKSLWILSRSAAMSPDVLANIESTASAQGFRTAKLVQINQTP
ncbi:MAG TPA: lipocalin family protein [Acidobacteriaceae bacterium]|nr:lipocalin family protein [Acidobacteriaceae bacterium]